MIIIIVLVLSLFHYELERFENVTYILPSSFHHFCVVGLQGCFTGGEFLAGRGVQPWLQPNSKTLAKSAFGAQLPLYPTTRSIPIG